MNKEWCFGAVAGLLLCSATPLPWSPAERGEARHAATPSAAVEAALPAPNSAPIQQAALVTPPPPPEPVVVEPEPQPTPDEGVHIVVSLPAQTAYVFKDGELHATSPVSTGKRGHETPVGSFRILQKKVHHRSNKYDDAPMPYMQRLTWQGVALHAGRVPGYPASHGCIRLPKRFAKTLYGLTDFDTWVTVTDAEPETAEAALDLA